MEDKSLNFKKKRFNIIHAAIKVFAEKGFHAAKVEDISQEAEIGKGTIYQYFASKEDLFMETYKYIIQQYTDSIGEKLRQQPDISGKLKTFAWMHLEFVQNYADMARVAVSQEDGLMKFKDFVWQSRQARVKMVEEIIKDGINRGEFRPLDANLAAQAFLGMVVSLGGNIFFQREAVDIPAMADKICDLFMLGITHR